MAFSFVHTADIHLDSPLKSLALRDPDLAEMVAGASRRTLTRIIDLCLAEQVQALLIAGDLYDGAQTSMKTAGFLARQLERLDAAGIETFIIRGNHDAASRITRELLLPGSVHVFTGRAGVEEREWNGQPVAIHGISFARPHAPDSLLDRFGAPQPGAFNIGMLHTSLGGSPGHDPYAPCTLAELQATGFDYWALGHIHKRAVHEGQTTVVMPGIPQGRDMGESGEKSVTLVRVDGDEVTVEARALAVARFDRLEVGCDGLTDWADMVQALKAALRAIDPGEVQRIVRPVLTGATPLTWRATRDRDLLLAEAQSEAEGADGLWIDKLSLELRAEGDTAPAGPVGELMEMISDSPLPPEDARVRAEYEALRKHLPAELRGIFGADEAETATTLTREMEAGARDLLARLDGEG